MIHIHKEENGLIQYGMLNSKVITTSNVGGFRKRTLHICDVNIGCPHNEKS